MRGCFLLLAGFVFAMPPTTCTAFAGGYWRFYISVDGKPAFTGGVGVFGEFSPLDHLESSVRGGVQLGTDSFLDENTSGDITLTGDVVFRDQEHPPLHMQRLRLVYDRHLADRLSGTLVAGGYYDWRLHLDDAAFIVSHYRNRANAARTAKLATSLGAVACVVSISVFVWKRRRRRLNHLVHVGLKTA